MTYLEFLEYIAKKAGRIMRKNFGLKMQKEIKSDNTPVTITDKKINSLVIKELKKYFPTHDLLGEEESNFKNNSDYLWVCDPVDGTIPFSCGFPISTFSLALVYKGEPIAGVIYDPFFKRLLIGEKGKGAFLNGERVFVNNHNKIGPTTIMSGEFFSTAKYDFLPAISKLRDKRIKFFKFSSVLYGGIMLCAGEIDGVIFPNSFTHDGVSLKILVEEAGGKMTDVFGNEQRYDRDINGYIATNGKIHDELVEIVKNNI
ncbi:MAG: inositol monophosphatase [Candidatus Gracilibacteria bacterium]|nr:inositol monophosphatase [Candidatus Gracilibacteria bacterium]